MDNVQASEIGPQQNTRTGRAALRSRSIFASRGDYNGPVRETSTYLMASEHKLMTAAVALGAGLILASLFRNNE